MGGVGGFVESETLVKGGGGGGVGLFIDYMHSRYIMRMSGITKVGR